MVATEKKKTSLARAVFSGSLGNMLEWFDYGLYGYFAAIISADFFVADDPIVGFCSASWSLERAFSSDLSAASLSAHTPTSTEESKH